MFKSVENTQLSPTYKQFYLTDLLFCPRLANYIKWHLFKVVTCVKDSVRNSQTATSPLQSIAFQTQETWSADTKKRSQIMNFITKLFLLIWSRWTFLRFWNKTIRVNVFNKPWTFPDLSSKDGDWFKQYSNGKYLKIHNSWLSKCQSQV